MNLDKRGNMKEEGTDQTKIIKKGLEERKTKVKGKDYDPLNARRISDLATVLRNKKNKTKRNQQGRRSFPILIKTALLRLRY